MHMFVAKFMAQWKYKRVYRTQYDKLTLAAMCCRLANNLTHFKSHMRQTDERP